AAAEPGERVVLSRLLRLDQPQREGDLPALHGLVRRQSGPPLEYPPVEAATRYVECMGGADAVLEKARRAYDAGDYRWVAQLVNHVVFADPKNTAALELQATTLEQLGYQVENATWRNFYLMGARELREGVAGSAMVASSPDVIVALSMEELLDALA